MANKNPHLKKLPRLSRKQLQAAHAHLKSAPDWLKKQHKNLQQKLFPTAWEDGAFMDDVRQATLRGAAPISNILFWVCGSFLLVLFLLASVVRIDEVTSGMGKVIPSSNVQILQNLDGGIVAEIVVSEGDVVQKNQPLVRIDSTGFASSYAEKQSRITFLQAEIARLDGHINNYSPDFPENLVKTMPKLIADQKDLFASQEKELEESRDVFIQQINQRQQDLNEANERLLSAERGYELISQELQMSEAMAKKGVIPEMNLLQVRRQANDIQSDLSSARLDVPRAQAALEEAQARLNEYRAKARRELMDQKSEKEDELARLQENIVAVRDKVERSIIRAPVTGTVSRVLVNTIGGVLQPGEDVIELIPAQEKLLIEARIRPQDIAFLRPQQEAMVKITAYDYSIYGGLKGHLTTIGSNTVVDEDGQAYYPVKVRTEKGALKASDGRLLPIIPGMVANVDILTGKRTVLNYLLKPYYKVRDNALRER